MNNIKRPHGLCFLVLCCTILNTACINQPNETPVTEASEQPVTDEQETALPASSSPLSAAEYQELRQKITYGSATIPEVLKALTEQDAGALANTMHALYSMRWNRNIYKLLIDLWQLKKEKYPGLAWNLFAEPPVRIALASTINRIKIFDTEEYKTYIRAHENDEHEFHRAQVVIALGLNGDPVDIPYIKGMAEGNNIYVTQSAITALALMDAPQARDTLIELWENHKGSPLGHLIMEVLGKAYKWYPPEETGPDKKS